MIYDLESLLQERLREANSESKEELNALAKKSAGLLRVEVQLMKPTAICACTDNTLTINASIRSARFCYNILLFSAGRRCRKNGLAENYQTPALLLVRKAGDVFGGSCLPG